MYNGKCVINGYQTNKVYLFSLNTSKIQNLSKTIVSFKLFGPNEIKK